MEIESRVPAELQSDEVATRTDWAPLQPKEGANYRTRKAERVGDDRMIFVPSFTSKLIIVAIFGFTLIALSIGSGVTYMWLSGRAEKIGDGDPTIVKIAGPAFIAGALFFGGLGIYLKGKLLKPVGFDRNHGRFFRGSESDASAVDLAQIHSLQVIEKWIAPSGDSGGYTSLELNVVLKNAQRRNVIDHGEWESLKEDAERLAEFLGVPLWDFN